MTDPVPEYIIGWPGTEMRGFTTTNAPPECREFRTLTLPRRPS